MVVLVELVVVEVVMLVVVVVVEKPKFPRIKNYKKGSNPPPRTKDFFN